MYRDRTPAGSKWKTLPDRRSAAVSDLDSTRSNWDQLGHEAPLWAILSNPDSKSGMYEWDTDTFFSTGESDIKKLMDEIEARSISIKRRNALDFGCGVGRLTRALSHHFDNVIGIDVAPSMINLAQEMNTENGRCEFIANDRPDLQCVADNSIDLVYSVGTLQHIPPDVACCYIREFLRIVHPEGLVVFELLGGKDWTPYGVAYRLFPNQALNHVRRLRYRTSAVIELYGVPPCNVRGIVVSEGGELIDVDRDPSAIKGWINYVYYIKRRCS